MDQCAQRMIIRGRVQGVGFRWWARGEARRLGLSGWVRNRADGSVELLAIGPSGAIDALARDCRAGPDAADVTAIERETADDDGSVGFESRPTA
jgi:acylphosphatase